MKFLLITLITTWSFSNLSFANEKGERRGPPKEAISACQSKDDGATCSFTGRHGEVSGTCVKKDSSKPAACKPSGDRQR